jgi:hypothetical protein
MHEPLELLPAVEELLADELTPVLVLDPAPPAPPVLLKM